MIAVAGTSLLVFQRGLKAVLIGHSGHGVAALIRLTTSVAVHWLPQ
jgi:hypothetical protein